jgi:hypothetical protein
MWNCKVDNLLVYHRPFAQTAPQNPTCEFHSKKIRRQKTVGKKGVSIFEMRFSTRRFFFNNADPLGKYISDIGFDFKYKQGNIDFNKKECGIGDNSDVPEINF